MFTLVKNSPMKRVIVLLITVFLFVELTHGQSVDSFYNCWVYGDFNSTPRHDFIAYSVASFASGRNWITGRVDFPDGSSDLMYLEVDTVFPYWISGSYIIDTNLANVDLRYGIDIIELSNNDIAMVGVASVTNRSSEIAFITIDALFGNVSGSLIGTDNIEDVTSMTVAHDGNVILVGSIDRGFAYPTRPYIVKVNNQGNIIWARIGENGRKLYDITRRGDGNYVVVGSAEGGIYVAKINDQGEIIWSNIYGSSSSTTLGYGSGVIADSYETIVVSGSYFDTTISQRVGVILFLNQTGLISKAYRIIDTTGGGIGAVSLQGVQEVPYPTIDLNYVAIGYVNGLSGFGGYSTEDIIIVRFTSDSVYSIMTAGGLTSDRASRITPKVDSSGFLVVGFSTSANMLTKFAYYMELPNYQNGTFKCGTWCGYKENNIIYWATDGLRRITLLNDSTSLDTNTTSTPLPSLSASSFRAPNIYEINGRRLTIDTLDITPFDRGARWKISLTVNGGTMFTSYPDSFYVYHWITGDSTTDPYLYVYDPGLYGVTVLDRLGCTYTEGFIIDTIFPLRAQIDRSMFPPKLRVNIAGGMAPYTCLWNTGDTSCVEITAPDTMSLFVVDVSDKAGCNSSDSIKLGVSSLEQVNSPYCFINVQNDGIIVECSDNGNYEVMVYDLLGHLVKKCSVIGKSKCPIPANVLNNPFLIRIYSMQDNSYRSFKMVLFEGPNYGNK